MNRSLSIVALAVITIWAFWPAAGASVDPGVRVAPGSAHNPVLAGDSLPDGFRQLLPRDAIAPVYQPVFLPEEQVLWPGDAQVIGVAEGDEAKAYPVSFLNRREMVVDSISGIPILVTW